MTELSKSTDYQKLIKQIGITYDAIKAKLFLLQKQE